MSLMHRNTVNQANAEPSQTAPTANEPSCV